MVIARDPGLQFTRETWWDALLFLYASEGGAAPPYGVSLTLPPGVRETTTLRITADLRFIFRASPHWLHFINLPRFFGSLLDPHARHNIQPGLILGALALSTFFRSHDGELGARGRERAMALRDRAQSAVEASLNSRWLDHGLVQAAWVSGYLALLSHLVLTAGYLCFTVDFPAPRIFRNLCASATLDGPCPFVDGAARLVAPESELVGVGRGQSSRIRVLQRCPDSPCHVAHAVPAVVIYGHVCSSDPTVCRVAVPGCSRLVTSSNSASYVTSRTSTT